MTDSRRNRIGLERCYPPPGTAPGVLETIGKSSLKGTTITVIRYSEEHFSENRVTSINECWQNPIEGTVLWIDIQGLPDPDILHALGQHYGLNPLALEDVLNTGHRPKWDSYNGHSFLVMDLLTGGDPIRACQVSIFLAENLVITFVECDDGAFQPIRQRLRDSSGAARKLGAGYLCYSICDALVDRFFPLLERLQDALDDLEDQLIIDPDPSIPAKVHRLKRDYLLVGRVAMAEREVLNSLLRDDVELMAGETTIYLRDCYDHIIQVIDMIETLRDIATELMNSYLSMVSNQMNSVMKVLTIIATIFIPLTFLVGVYGMNFNTAAGPLNMPELNLPYGYAMIWGIMILCVLGMIIVFRRKKWL